MSVGKLEGPVKDSIDFLPMQFVFHHCSTLERDHGETYPMKDFLAWFTSPSGILAVFQENRGYEKSISKD